MKNIFFLLVGVVVIAGSFYLFLQKTASPQYQQENWRTEEVVLPGPALKVGDTLIPVDVADTQEKRTRGLSGREALQRNTGLLFIFDTSGKHGFWMKDMNFPIDIVWIDENWRVVSVESGVEPETYPTVFYPEESAKYVLELNSGEAFTLGIDRGVEVSLVR